VRVRAHDQGFVLAPPAAVYATVSQPASYPSWWPGATCDADGRSTLRLPLEPGRRSPASVERHRPDVGAFLSLPGYRGTLEWYLEPFQEGTIVNGLLDVEAAGGRRGSERRLLRMRTSVRGALVGLHEALR
jgi:uncharacterized protein YndB with AHSA1/START domain